MSMEDEKDVQYQYFAMEEQDHSEMMYSPSLVSEKSPETAVNTFKDTLLSMIDSKFHLFAESSDLLDQSMGDVALRDILKLFSKSVNSAVESMVGGTVKYTPMSNDRLIGSLVDIFESAMNYSRNNKIIDAYVNCVSEQDESKQQVMLRNLASEFFEISKTYGELVVKEIALNPQQKVLKSAQIGGVAGGEKFIARSVLLKLAADKEIAPGRYLYGGVHENIEFAMKVRNPQIKSFSDFLSRDQHMK
jgi:hypothetical protein